MLCDLHSALPVPRVGSGRAGRIYPALCTYLCTHTFAPCWPCITLCSPTCRTSCLFHSKCLCVSQPPPFPPLLCSRCHWRMLPPPYHASLIDALQQAAGGMSRRARTRPGPGPGPWVALKRILPGPPPLQPVALALVAGGAGGGAAQQGPFIFNPYAAKRSAAAAAGAVQAVEWVSGGACRGTTAFRLRGAAGA